MEALVFARSRSVTGVMWFGAGAGEGGHVDDASDEAGLGGEVLRARGAAGI